VPLIISIIKLQFLPRVQGRICVILPDNFLVIFLVNSFLRICGIVIDFNFFALLKWIECPLPHFNGYQTVVQGRGTEWCIPLHCRVCPSLHQAKRLCLILCLYYFINSPANRIILTTKVPVKKKHQANKIKQTKDNVLLSKFTKKQN
jgi:hypothetical protein